MFSAAGPDCGAAATRRQLAARPGRCSRSRKVSGSRSSAAGLGEQLPQRGLGDGPAAEAGDDRVAVQPDAATGPSARWPTRSRRCPTASAFSSTTTRSRAAQRGAHRVQRERPERGDAERADLHTPSSRSSSTVSLIVPSTEPSATTIGLGVRRCGTGGPGRRSRGRTRRRTPRRSRDQLQRLALPGVREVAHLGERLRADHRADRDRVGRVEHLARLVAAAGTRRPAAGSGTSTPLVRRA